MKVTTVACIQGAWLPQGTFKNILDIGAGTGLLSLFAAQQKEGHIDAIEIEADAFEQLQENIAQSPWKAKIRGHHMDIRNFEKDTNKKYDLIISNPPFFEKQLKSSNDRINHARHEVGLSLETLVNCCNTLLADAGIVSIILPPEETSRLIQLCATRSLYPSSQLVISDTEHKKPNAIVTLLSREQCKPQLEKLVIKTKHRDYSKDFISLLEAYYLYL